MKKGKINVGKHEVGTKHYLQVRKARMRHGENPNENGTREGARSTTETNRNRIFTNSSFKGTTRRKKQL
jgi:hypothetical protein